MSGCFLNLAREHLGSEDKELVIVGENTETQFLRIKNSEIIFNIIEFQINIVVIGNRLLSHQGLRNGVSQINHISVINKVFNIRSSRLGQFGHRLTQISIDDVGNATNGEIVIQVEHLDTNAGIKEAFITIGIGAVEENAIALDVSA